MENGEKTGDVRMPEESTISYKSEKERYSYEDIVSAVMEERKLQEESKDSIRTFVKNSCKVLGQYWGGLEPLIEFIQGKLFFDRVVKIISAMEKDRDIKAIMTRVVVDKKLKKEQCEKINKTIMEVLKDGKSKEEQEKIELEYKAKDEKLETFRKIEKQMHKKFQNEYHKYINEVLKKEFKIEKFRTEEHLKEIEKVNEEILKLVKQKVNDILYSNEVRRMQCEAFEQEEFYNEKIDINKLSEEIKRLGEIYNVDSQKDIDSLIF
ncbi:MAG: hypothetical protein E7A63_17720 [Clostridium butyricum]|nr:hypothetical protein [Clostridium butyricum]